MLCVPLGLCSPRRFFAQIRNFGFGRVNAKLSIADPFDGMSERFAIVMDLPLRVGQNGCSVAVSKMGREEKATSRSLTRYV
jgi:hypothetical protein